MKKRVPVMGEEVSLGIRGVEMCGLGRREAIEGDKMREGKVWIQMSVEK